MILQGSIERFDLATVLQFLAQNVATGILDIRDSTEHGRIYLVKGRLEGISLPSSDDRLGIHLLRAGRLTEDQLAGVLVEQAMDAEGKEGRKPLGRRLVEKGLVSEEIVRQAMRNLAIARMFELAHWRSGVFTYDEPAEMPKFDIAIRVDIQELLLRTQVRIDHGERPRKRVGVRHEACYRCPVADCSPAIKLEYGTKDPCPWREMRTAADVRSEGRVEGDELYVSAAPESDERLQGALA